MNSKWRTRALYGIGAWTALGGITALVDPGAHCALFFGGEGLVDSDAALLVFRIAYAQLVAWGVGYALAARCSAMQTPMLAAGAMGKSIYAAIVIVAFARGSGTTALLATGVGDLLIASFFVVTLAQRAGAGTTTTLSRARLSVRRSLP